MYMGTLLIRNSTHLGPYSGTMPRALWWSLGGGSIFVGEVPLSTCLGVDRPVSGVVVNFRGKGATSDLSCPRSCYRGTSLVRKCPPS